MGIRVHHLNCATLCPPARPLVDGTGSWLEAGCMVCHCLLIETATTLVLVDTGLGLRDLQDPDRRLGAIFHRLIRPRLDPAEAAVSQVRARGFDPADVRHVVATHLDVDHAGGLGDFPGARVHVTAAEHEAALRPRTLPEHHRYRAAHWAHGPDWAVRAPGGEAWHGFEGVQALLPDEPDVLLVPLVGHSRGQTGVAVRTSAGWLLHAADAYYHREQLAPQPSCPPALELMQRVCEADGRARVANLARLHALAQTGEVTIFCAHDAVELARLTQAAEGLRQAAGAG